MSSERIAPGPPAATTMISKLRLALRFRGNWFGTVMEDYRTYGDTVLYQIDGMRQYMITRPEHYHQVLVTDAHKYHKGGDYKDTERGLAFFLGNGLVTSDGEFWKRQRKLIQPAFHARRIESYAGIMISATERLLDTWRDGQLVDVDRDMMKLTLDIVAKSLFDTSVASDADRIGRALTVLQRMFARREILPRWVPRLSRRREKQALRDLDAIVFRLINQRRASGEDRGDLLSVLLSARDENGEGMTDRQVRDEAVTLILAGHETTANLLNWTWVLLAQNPDVEAKLHAELDDVLGGRLPTLDDLKRLPYTEMVLKESLRIYPPVYGFSRMAVEDTDIDGYPVPRGTIISLMTYLTHHNPEYWPEPERFIPERFTEENEKTHTRYAYLPFGAGPRICIGNGFAMLEARLILASIASRYRLKLEPGQVVEMEPLITLRPKGGLRMRLEARQPAPPRSQAEAGRALEAV